MAPSLELSQPEEGQDSSDDNHQSDEVNNAVHNELLSIPAAANELVNLWFHRMRLAWTGESYRNLRVLVQKSDLNRTLRL